jgi:non-ribosomal peptide synthetase component F
MLGCCVNTVPLRIRVNDELSLGAWLRALAGEHEQVRERERTPLTDIRTWHTVPGETPLFESLLVYNRRSLDREMRGIPSVPGGSRFTVLSHTNLPLVLEVRGEGGAISLTYTSDRYTPHSARRVMAGLQNILRGMARGEGECVGNLDVLTDDEERTIVHGWNDTRVDFSPAGCVHELVAAQAAKTPGAVAVRCGNERLTYSEMDGRSDLIAARLASLGVAPGAVVGIAVERSCALPVCLLGILKAGAAYMPLDHTLPLSRLRFMLADAGAAVVVCSRSTEALIAGSPARPLRHPLRQRRTDRP